MNIIKRFFVIMFTPGTYEIEYSMEICRMLFLILIDVFLAILRGPIFDLPLWTNVPIMLSFLFFFMFILASTSRLISIKAVKKDSVLITLKQLNLIIESFPTENIYLKVNKKYIIIKPNTSINLSDINSIILIAIGKSYLDPNANLEKKLQDIFEKSKNN